MYDKINLILSAQWLIEGETALRYILAIAAVLKTGKFDEKDFKAETSKPFAASDANMVDRWDIDSGDVPPNSVGVIPIEGVITSWNSMRLEKAIKQAEQNPNIIALFFPTNSPGGMVFYTDIVAKAIANSTLYTHAHVMQMAASAAMWQISGAKRITVSSELDRLGSIGVMTNWMNMEGALKKIGIEIKDIYATLSTKKNNATRSLQKGDDSVIIEELDFANTVFHKAIQNNMGIDPKSEIFAGDMFYAQKAIDLKLAHEITDMQTAFEQAVKFGNLHKINYYFKNH
jgi:ClpP class serine protease